MALICVKRNKTYKNRKLVIYDGNKQIAYATPWMGWYGITLKVPISTVKLGEGSEIRRLFMENLYWLLGHDCNFEEWNESIEAWDKGKHIYGVPVDKLSSMFFEGEKEIALNSFYNK
jgi:hypothetical protein